MSRRSTESFVALKAEVRTWRWAGVPFYLRTGKRLPSKVSEIVIQFRAPPFSIFPPEAAEWRPNTLIIRLQPEEGMRLEMMTKDPGPGGLRLSPTGLDISFEKTFGKRFPDAYERLLMDTVRGNPTLFMRHDEVEAAWAWVEPILEAWARAAGPSAALSGGKLGPDGGDRADRARRAHLARGDGVIQQSPHALTVIARRQQRRGNRHRRGARDCRVAFAPGNDRDGSLSPFWWPK